MAEQNSKFVMCSCGIHGHFIFSDGTESKEITCYQEGFNLLMALLMEHKINGQEYASLLSQLKNSSVLTFIELKEKIKTILKDMGMEEEGWDIVSMEFISSTMNASGFLDKFHGHTMN